MIPLILAVPFIVMLVYGVYAGIKYTRLIGRIFSDLVFMPEERFSAVTVQGEEESIIGDSNEKITFLITVKPKDSNKIMIFCPESGESKESWEKYAYFFPKLGFQIISVDFDDLQKDREKNHFTQWPLKEDSKKLLKVIEWIKKSNHTAVSIILFGVSKGADIVFAALHSDPAVKGVITDGLFSMHEVFADYIRRWAPMLVRTNLFGDKYPDWVVQLFANLGYWQSQRVCGKKFIEVRAFLKKHHPPLLMIHGQKDEYVSEAHQKVLERNYKNCSIFHRLVVEDAKHNAAILTNPEKYIEAITRFLSESGLLNKG